MAARLGLIDVVDRFLLHDTYATSISEETLVSDLPLVVISYDIRQDQCGLYRTI